jgi:hypothetical protein
MNASSLVSGEVCMGISEWKYTQDTATPVLFQRNFYFYLQIKTFVNKNRKYNRFIGIFSKIFFIKFAKKNRIFPVRTL